MTYNKEFTEYVRDVFGYKIYTECLNRANPDITMEILTVVLNEFKSEAHKQSIICGMSPPCDCGI
jgi:hypothetical protein